MTDANIPMKWILVACLLIFAMASVGMSMSGVGMLVWKEKIPATEAFEHLDNPGPEFTSFNECVIWASRYALDPFRCHKLYEREESTACLYFLELSLVSRFFVGPKEGCPIFNSNW